MKRIEPVLIVRFKIAVRFLIQPEIFGLDFFRELLITFN